MQILDGVEGKKLFTQKADEGVEIVLTKVKFEEQQALVMPKGQLDEQQALGMVFVLPKVQLAEQKALVMNLMGEGFPCRLLRLVLPSVSTSWS